MARKGAHKRVMTALQKAAKKRKKLAADKVRELVKKGHRLAKGAGSDVYQEATQQRRMGTGTGRRAEHIAERIKRGR